MFSLFLLLNVQVGEGGPEVDWGPARNIALPTGSIARTPSCRYRIVTGAIYGSGSCAEGGTLDYSSAGNNGVHHVYHREMG